MRAILLTLFVATVLTQCEAAIPAGPAALYTSHCKGCNTIGSALANRDGSAIVAGGSSAFGLMKTDNGSWPWIENFVDYGSEQEGPFAFDGRGLLAGLAPNSGTVETVWGINPLNGNNTWNVFDDASMDQLSLVSTPEAFFTGSVTSQALVRLDPLTGAKKWTTSLTDLIFNIAAARVDPAAEKNKTADKFAIIVAYGNTVGAYDDATGLLIWNVTGLPTQMTQLAVDDSTGVVYLSGAADPNGDPLTYSTLYAFDVHTGHQVWSQNISVVLSPMINVMGPHVYFYSANGVYTVDAKTGESLWNATLHSTSINQLPVAAPGRWNATTAVLYASVHGTDLTCFKAQTGEALWSTALGLSQQATFGPLIVKDILYVAVVDSNSAAYLVAFPTH